MTSLTCLTSGFLPGCHRVFSCGDDEQCRLDGAPGVCEFDGFCSFPDPACASGRRYGEHASRVLAGACVQVSVGGSEESTGTTAGDGSTSTISEFTSTSDTSDSTGGACQSYESIVGAEPGLMLWHRMEEERFGTAIDDAQGLDGQYHDASGEAALDFGIPGPGGTGTAVRFHATAADSGGSGLRLNARVRGEIGTFPWFEGTPYTIELWYRAEHGVSAGTSPLMTVERYLELGFRFRFRHDTRVLVFDGWPAASDDALVVDAGSFGEWHHVVVTIEPSDRVQHVRLHLDGEYAGERDATWSLMHQCPDEPCSVAGFVGSGQGQHANLEIDEFAVYDGLLSSETIAAHEHAGRHDCALER